MERLATFAQLSDAVVTTAIHAGHELRPEVAVRSALDDATRLREEDPYTDRFATISAASVVAHRSRFEVDLNRPRERAVYRRPDDAWGLPVWTEPLPDHEIDRSLGLYDDFYAQLGTSLDAVAARGPFVVLDLHSYNHRRDGADCEPAPASENPDVNVGTDALDRDCWGHLVDRFMLDLGRCEALGRRLDVRENVRFRGGELSRWINERYAGRGCALAIECKKTFMDEWTGSVDERHLEALHDALGSTIPGLRAAVGAPR